MRLLSYITRTVLILSFVSLFADFSSEMLYPVMPEFLRQAGFGKFGIGLLEGLVVVVAGFGKVFFGSLSDGLDRRVVFIRGGYFLSALAKPLMGLLPYVLPVALFRGMDRLGKGMRGAPRDALLVRSSGTGDRGKVFGFHRGMDTLGAVIGPAFALLYLWFRPDDLVGLFLVAFLPGMAGVACTFFLNKERPAPEKNVSRNPFQGIFQFWRTSEPRYRRLLTGFLLFSLLNSTDLLLILRAGEAGLGMQEVIGAYMLYNLVYALCSLPLGGLGDRFGFRPVYLASVAVFAMCYLGMGVVLEKWMIWGIFGLYGVFTAAHEGITKSWLSLHIARERQATGLGLFQFLNPLCLLAASAGAGLLWDRTSGETAFFAIGAAALGLGILLIFLLPRNQNPSHP